MNIEVLAPAGSSAALSAAVRSGADAVYFGGKQFNARRNAENFDDISMEQAVRYCCLHGVKAYLTLNTLMKDSELESAVLLAKEAYAAGIDGVIIQDVGLACVLARVLPGLALHASTQMSVHSPAALRLLQRMEFKRVVAAREMSGEHLWGLCAEARKLQMEVEVFVHGALCMCLSGQCYFSATLGGRSANRGLCAGTCRLPFSAEGGTGHDLSLKDLCLVEHITELKKIGVASLKIEGRMKRPEYVAAATCCIKQAVTTGQVDKPRLKQLQDVFSRSGFTDGYFTNQLGRQMFGVRTEQDESNSNESYTALHELYRRERQHLPADFHLLVTAGQPAVLTMRCAAHCVRVTGAQPQAAINAPLNEARATQALSKLGGTPYHPETVTCKIDPQLMLPISALNAMRQQAVLEMDALRTATIAPPTVNYHAPVPAGVRHLHAYFARFASPEQLPPDCATLQGFSLPAQFLTTPAQVEAVLQQTQLEPRLLAAELPRGVLEETVLERQLSALRANGIMQVVCGNLSAIALALEAGFTVIGGFGLNLFNSESLSYIRQLGVRDAVLSPELSLEELKAIALPHDGLRTYVFCYGRLPVMLTRNCPVKNGTGCAAKQSFCTITDRKHLHFPVVCQNGFCEILNAHPLVASDWTRKISADIGYLYFTTETAAEVAAVMEQYRTGKTPDGIYTRGLLKDGVL